jgi:hypothetical protein
VVAWLMLTSSDYLLSESDRASYKSRMPLAV